jgi:hypothetical protein
VVNFIDSSGGSVSATTIYISPTQIQVITPPEGYPGTYSIQITNTDGGTFTLAGCFSYIPAGLYHQISDISAELLRRGFTLGGTVTAPTLSIWISQTEARVNGRVSLRYALPITQKDNPQAYAMLGYICTLLTADRTDRVARNNEAGDVKSSGSKTFASGNKRMTEGEDLLEQIMRLELILLDATPITQLSNVVSGTQRTKEFINTSATFWQTTGYSWAGPITWKSW